MSRSTAPVIRYARIALLCALPASFLVSAAPGDTGPPKIIFLTRDAIDFGKTTPGVLRDTLVVVNAGDEPLRDLDFKSSCDCMTGTVDRMTLKKGDTARVAVALDMKDGNPGRRLMTVWVNSNDPERPQIQIPVEVDIYRDAEFTDRKIECDTVTHHCTWTVKVTNTGQDPITIAPPENIFSDQIQIAFNMTAPITLKPYEDMLLIGDVNLAPGAGRHAVATRLHVISRTEYDLRLAWSGDV
ncbi:MAG: hypothetical protein JWQ98_2153 [Chlorobi bacterium]|nr:hypothetical protein [Chlorobiota bacterium]